MSNLLHLAIDAGSGFDHRSGWKSAPSRELGCCSAWRPLDADPEPLQPRRAAMKTASREPRIQLSTDPDHRSR